MSTLRELLQQATWNALRRAVRSFVFDEELDSPTAAAAPQTGDPGDRRLAASGSRPDATARQDPENSDGLGDGGLAASGGLPTAAPRRDLLIADLVMYLRSVVVRSGDFSVEEVLLDELTAVQELASWQEPLTSVGLWSPEDLAGQQTETTMKDDLWQALESANASAPQMRTAARFGAARIPGLPILDPPTVQSRNQLIREDQPYYIAAGFIKLFPLGQGDYWAHVRARQQAGVPLSFWEWLQHLLLHADGRFQAHPRFYFFALNTALRSKALRSRSYFVKRQTGMNANVPHTNEELLRMGKAQFTKIVTAFEHSLPCSAQEKIHQRSDLEAMVEQIEQDTFEFQVQELEETAQTAAQACGAGDQPHTAAAGELRQSLLDCQRFLETMKVPGQASAAPDASPLLASEGVDRKQTAVRADTGLAASGGPAHDVRELAERLQVLLQRCKVGGEIPCHFTTLTTAIYHWQDLRACLRKYDAAVTQRRQGRADPVEPAMARLPESKRLVLKYPGVVAWYTAYKMELFYQHVLQYEDGQGIFEWGAGGIMHLHSINFGSKMPRVDPARFSAQDLDADGVKTAAQFALAHEEYLTDWSLGKAEKWQHAVMDRKRARVTRRGPMGSPLHTDSESDGSADMEPAKETRVPLRAAPQRLAPDEDYVSLFPTPRTLCYQLDDAGQRLVCRLTTADRAILCELDACLVDQKWHPCAIAVAAKALLMTNNCQLVRAARRKWYRRLTDACNLHDRHDGPPVEVPPLLAQGPPEAEGDATRPVVDVQVDVAAKVRITTFNMNQHSPDDEFAAVLPEMDLVCLQEVTPSCLSALHALAAASGFAVSSPLHRGRCSEEGFDVCVLCRLDFGRVMRACVSPVAGPNSRFMLHVLVQLAANGAVLCAATAHLTASRAAAAARQRELSACLAGLEALDVDACIFAGDLNMHAGERLPRGGWLDAHEVAGSPADFASTWEPLDVDVPAHADAVWRFDRVLWLRRPAAQSSTLADVDASNSVSSSRLAVSGGLGHSVRAPVGPASRQLGLAVSGGTSEAGPGPASRDTLELQPRDFASCFIMQGLSDHAAVTATMTCLPGNVATREWEENLIVCRPGLGREVARQPGDKESCAKQSRSHVYCGKDYEKARMLPGTGAVMEDGRRKGLYRLYGRRNCHHLNTHDPLKAMGLVANVDDQVVLTVQAAVNYLTKYIGKLGGGQSAASKMSSYIDEIICKMPDDQEMTVASLLSRLFIHAAVPQEISSLEAWHVLLDLPRVLSSRQVMALNAKDTQSFRDISEIERSNQEESALRPSKVENYMSRMRGKRDEALRAEDLQRMSWAKFLSRVTRGGRGQRLSLRRKPCIVKEKPFLQLDARRRDAAAMARLCLRLHRPFSGAAEDPMHLAEAEAVQQLQDFVCSSTCPRWLRKRYMKHNRQRPHRVAETPVSACVPEHEQPAVVADAGPATAGGPAASPGSRLAASGGPERADAQDTHTAADAGLAASGGPAVSAGSRLAALGGPEPAGAQDKHAAAEQQDAQTEPRLAASGGLANSAERPHFAALVSCPEEMQWLAARHVLLWTTRAGDMRYSVEQCLKDHRPPPRVQQMRAYLKALGEPYPSGAKLPTLSKVFVAAMLWLDLQPYQKRGAGCSKPALKSSQVKALLEQYFANHTRDFTDKQKKRMKERPYAEMWNEVKRLTLRDCGLQVAVAEQHRVAMLPEQPDTRAPERQGAWRERVFCVAPFLEQSEEWEDPAAREAKRARYVQGAMHEQSMGRSGNPLHEVALPEDAGSLSCRDESTRAEWDALNQYVSLMQPLAINPEAVADVPAATRKYLLKPSQGGLSQVEAAALARQDRNVAASVALEDLDPTQRSFADHLCAWAEAYRAQQELFEQNLPSLAASGGAGQLPGSLAALSAPALLLGTAGTGKTTTMQVANDALERSGLAGRVVRMAYTGVAASNMGAGSRTIMSLLRLNSRNAFFGQLAPLSEDDMRELDAELGRMAVLEIDELSMVEKLVLAYIHRRLCEWRYAVYHPQHCDGRQCRCGARMPFGGVKVVLAGDFGQLPPVAVAAEKTLLHARPLQAGQSREEVNLGLRLFLGIKNVFRLRRIHRQVGQSAYKDSLLRVRDAAHTKEDVQLWQSHDLTSPSCALTPSERVAFEKERVHMFCENRKAGLFNGQRLGEHAAEQGRGHILRVWSVESSEMTERHKCEHYGQLRRVLHLAQGAHVMLVLNLRTCWNLVNGLRGTVVAVLLEPQQSGGDKAEGRKLP